VLRRSLPIVLAATLVLGVAVDTAAAGPLSKRTALKQAGKVAKRAAIQSEGVYWFAGACHRRSASKVACWGGVAYADGEGCIQKVVVSRAGKLRARRTGKIFCGRLPRNASGGTGSGGGSPVVCAIRSSVCI
jgi:hypothetical protein